MSSPWIWWKRKEKAGGRSILSRLGLVSFAFVILFHKTECQSNVDDDGIYRGKSLGRLNSYHHQVSGEVYAVDEFTLLFRNFNYDGNGADTFFWAGASNRPGPQGFIVPDKWGKTNILDRYFNDEFTLRLPDNKKLTEIQWFSIYDLNTQNNFGDVYIPEDFEPPKSQFIGSLTTTGNPGGEVSTGSIEVLNSKTIRIPNLHYNGRGLSFFFAGDGPIPHRRGFKVPDELGYVDYIRPYVNETIVLVLPGDKTIFNINWFSIFEPSTETNFASILLDASLNVPPALAKVTSLANALPNCRQLHRNMRVSWEVFGPQITIQLSGLMGDDDYMAFGISGSQQRSQMLGSDIAIVYIVKGIQGIVVDYNVTSLAPCVQVLGANKGVCRDEEVGGMESNQLLTFSRENGVSTVNFRRNLKSADDGDQEYVLTRPMYVVWAMGRLDSNKEPAFHDVYPKRDIIIHFNPEEPTSDCFPFSNEKSRKVEVWEKSQIYDRSVRSFTATLGPSGGKKGYQGITKHVSSGLSWYINGLLIPELWLRRGLTYVFKVRGGNNPHSPEYYHPMVITDEPHGGFDRLTEAKQASIRVLAGVEFTRRGRPKPTAAGPLCISKYPEGYDRRLDDTWMSFKKWNRSLVSECDGGEPAYLEITPNSSWPDVAYYHSFTHANMGWKLRVVDSYAVAARNAETSLRTSGALILAALFLISRL